MRILLDIDGVMVPLKGWVIPENLSDGFPAFSQSATHALLKILQPHDTIVLTTSHRFRFSVEEWIEMFKLRGISTNIERMTAEGMTRKDKVLDYLKDSIDEDFVIIDDDSTLHGLPQKLKKHLVVTAPILGLSSSALEHCPCLASRFKH